MRFENKEELQNAFSVFKACIASVIVLSVIYKNSMMSCTGRVEQVKNRTGARVVLSGVCRHIYL